MTSALRGWPLARFAIRPSGPTTRTVGVRRTSTVLVVGPDGRIAKRASGQPRKADVIAALGDAG